MSIQSLYEPHSQQPKKRPSTYWTNDRENQLETILSRNPTPFVVEVVIEMNAASRNVIIGKARRMGLKLRPQTHTNKPRKKRRPYGSGKKPAIGLPDFLAAAERRQQASATALANVAKRQAEDEAAAQTTGIGFFDIQTGLCRWPLTDAYPISAFKFCGMKTEKGLVYCGHHMRRSLRAFCAEVAE